jgi:hypothetical protein
VDTTRRDPRLWVQLGIASDHIEFIGFIRRYASEHTSTKSATELLFLLDALVQASRDTLGVLLDSEPATQLLWTRETDANAYELIRRIRQHYVRELNARGLTSKMAIDRHYDAVRMAILNGIIAGARDGYRVNDARFLLGVIHWRARRPAAALESWRALTEGSDGRHSAVSSQIRRLLLERPADDGVMRRPRWTVQNRQFLDRQNRQFPAAETGEFYFEVSSVRKSVWTLVRQLFGPHLSTCA